MSELKLTKREELEAYISVAGLICLSQPDPEDPSGGDCVEIDKRDVPVVIGWLQQLSAEASDSDD